MSSQVLTNPKSPHSPDVQNRGEILYPETDGKPMAETDKHRELITELIKTLEDFFADETDVYVTGNILLYYEPENIRKFVAPDVFIVKGVEKMQRRIFKLWEEKIPEVVFEISSHSTALDDLNRKFRLYEKLGIKEYYIFDPDYAYLESPLIAFHLRENEYEEIELTDNKILSPSLNLELINTGETLRLRNPATDEFLPTREDLKNRVSELERLLNQKEKT
jgi:Uma2 family endonuclease